MKFVAAFLALALLAGCAHTRSGDTIHWQEGERLAVVAAGADLVSTAVALDAGARETNPLLIFEDEWALATSACFSTVYHLLLRRKLRKFPRQYQARWWGAVSGVRFAAVAWNVDVALEEAKP